MNWEVEWTDFQSKFLYSTARYPNMTSAWGTGKTMTAIAKGVILSGLYPGNKGLILRENMTDLRDSTMSDFRDYTGLKIKTQSKSCTISNGKGYPTSEILFHHVDEMAGVVQNINLGWFFIEQAEELDTDEVFEKLGGRLRRVLTPKKDVQQQLVELGTLDKIVDDFKDLSYEQKLRAESSIICDLKLPLRQGFCIANANGHNWNWRKFINKSGTDCLLGKKFEIESNKSGKVYSYGDLASLTEATTYDNLDNLPADFVTSLRVKEESQPSVYRRFVLNSHEDTDCDDACIPYSHVLRAVKADVFCLHEKRRVVCCDPAEFGNDKTIIMALEEGKITLIEALRKKEPMETAGRIARMYKQTGASVAALDSIGIGAGIRSRLSELGINVMGINSGTKSNNPDEYRNLKAEMWMLAQEMFRDNLISLPDNDELLEDLASIRYFTNSKGQIAIEKKDDTKKRLGRSPDMGDCFILGLYALKGVGFDQIIEQEEVDSDIANSYTITTVL